MLQLVTKNWGLKLISLVLAVGLWNYALGEEGVEVTRSIPLEIEIENTQISLLHISTRRVKVLLSAPRSLLSNLASADIKAVHKVGSEAKVAGEYSFRLEAREIKLPSPQIRVLKVEPEVVSVTLDELIVQKLKVKPNFVGEPAFGYTVKEEEIELNPNAILIEGPKGQLEKLDSVKTEMLDLVGRIRSFRRTVSLDLPSNVKPLNEKLVDIYVPIKEEFKEKNFESVPLKVFRPADSDEKISANPEKISFVLKGSLRQLEKLTPKSIIAYVDASKLAAGEHNVPVEMVLPEDVELADKKALQVKVTIKKSNLFS